MSEETENLVVDFTNRILELGGFDLTASAEETADGFKVRVEGDDVPLLLSHNAELLDALEYLANRLLVREGTVGGRIVFDSGTYRDQRERELRVMAEKAAERVRASRVPFSFDPMSPNERRIIHLALVDDETVRTESQGNGLDRKVTVYPA